MANQKENPELDSIKPEEQKKNRVKLDSSMFARLWIKEKESNRIITTNESSKDQKEKRKKQLKKTKKQIRFPNPETLAKWWQEAENQIKLAHPHETIKIRQQLIEKYVQSRLQKHLDRVRQHLEPQPEEKQISEWYREELLKLREENPNRPLKDREKMATVIVKEKIKQYKRIIRLDEFFG